jgi:translocation and assembly module TamB
MTGRYHDMDIVSVFVPALAEPRGELRWDISLDGTLDAPRVSGSGTLTQAGAALPELGIKLSDIELRIEATETQELRFEGSARSGRGTLSLNGEWLLDARAGWPLHAAIKGADVEIVRRPGLWIVATPDLSADIKDRQLTLRGTVRIPRADIEMKGLPETAIAPSPDVVIVRRRDEAAADKGPKGWRTVMEVRLLPEDQVNFEGFGLTGRVKGDLLLNYSPGKPVLGTGSLEIVNGRYQAFGMDLDIEQGKLVFANSPIDNPAIDLRAVRVIEESGTVITVGLHAQGRLKDATVTLYSEPPMAESDILSYLLLGRPPGEATGSEADLLMAAAAAVGTSQAYVAAKRLAQSLGFEETRVTPSGLVLGKSLSSRMYLTYEIGLLAPTNTLQIRYRLSDHWAIKAESSEAESADLIYTIER